MDVRYTLEACANADSDGNDASLSLGGDQATHTLDLTVDEYNSLKRHLARLRGYDVPEVAGVPRLPETPVGSLAAARARFAGLSDLALKHGDVQLLNHFSVTLSAFVDEKLGTLTHLNRVRRELDAERAIAHRPRLLRRSK